VIVVTSGAIGVGCQRLGLATKPTSIAQRQALAAIGQGHLMRFYEDFFAALDLVRMPRPPQRTAPPPDTAAAGRCRRRRLAPRCC
jgi:hypothetical protein